MSIALINMTTDGSTGGIMHRLAQMARENGMTVFTYSPAELPSKVKGSSSIPNGHICYGSRLERRLDNILGRVFGLNGLQAWFGTAGLIRSLKKNGVDVVHLHNLHSYCINLPMLFRFFKKNHIKVIWTLHDCWTFTGHCPHFTMAHCDKWKTGCHHCPQCREYPQSLLDSSRLMWRLKRRWITGVEDMTVVTPSQWLAKLVGQSYLKDYPVNVINNGIDLSVFQPTDSDFREKHGITPQQKMLLGVAFGWGKKKGLDVFLELARRLNPEQYRIVLVGTDAMTDRMLPEEIISVHRTQDRKELAEIYSAADLFVNPTREENYPTVNMESIACGTPVLTFRTGGSPEILNEVTGSVVDCDNIDAMEREIIRICMEKEFAEAACIKHAESFDENEKFKEYISLFREKKMSGTGRI